MPKHHDRAPLSRALLLVHVVAIAAGALLIAAPLLPALAFTLDAAGSHVWRSASLLACWRAPGASLILLGAGGVATFALSALTQRPGYRWAALALGALAVVLSLVAHHGLQDFNPLADSSSSTATLEPLVAQPRDAALVAAPRGVQLRALPFWVAGVSGALLALAALSALRLGRSREQHIAAEADAARLTGTPTRRTSR